MVEHLRALALRRGVYGDSGPFLAVWVLIVGFRLLKRLAGSEPEVVYRGEIEPGDQLVITHLTETHG